MTHPGQTNPTQPDPLSATRRVARVAPAALCHALVIGLGLSLGLLGGCTTYTDYAAFVQQAEPAGEVEHYVIEAPDVVLIKSRRVREIDGFSSAIPPDGILHLPLIGPVSAVNKTCPQLAAELERKSRQFYDDADVTVRVTGFRSKQVFVFGEVGAPGRYSYTGNDTVLSILSRAQPSRLADPARIQIIRPDPDKELRRAMTVNLDEMVQDGDTTLDVPLLEGDIVYVPANGFASVGLALQQLLLPIQPMTSTLRAPTDLYDAGDSTATIGQEN